MAAGPGFVSLAEVIRQVRSELGLARQEGARGELGFAVDKVSLECSVQLHRAGTAGGGLRIGVVTADLAGTLDRTTTHRVTVELTPQWNSGRLEVARPEGTLGR